MPSTKHKNKRKNKLAKNYSFSGKRYATVNAFGVIPNSSNTAVGPSADLAPPFNASFAQTTDRAPPRPMYFVPPPAPNDDGSSMEQMPFSQLSQNGQVEQSATYAY